MERLFVELSVLVFLATVAGIALRGLRQPLVLAYIIAGVIAGPIGLNLISSTELIGTLSSFGIALLLFLVGIELDLVKLRAIGRPSVILGIGQVVFTALFGFIIIKGFGIATLPAIYVAVAITFSSTIIVVKLLSEQRSLDSLHGRLAIGMLLVQDFIAIIALMVLAGVSTSQQFGPLMTVAITILKGLALAGIAALASRYLLPPLFQRFARSDELLFMASISWCLFFAGIATTIGLSLEIGAFIAGLALAPLPYNLEIVGKLRGIRDFFITLFFITLGSQLAFGTGQIQGGLVLALSLFVLIGNPLIVMLIMGSMGYRRRTSFLVGLTVAQISEFSLILMGMGLRVGHVTANEVALVTVVGVITITISTYFINGGEYIYRRLKRYLGIFERPSSSPEDEPAVTSGHVVLFGYHRLGEQIIQTLRKLPQPVLVVDFNPIAIRHLKEDNIPCVYGDMADLEMVERLQLERAVLVISTNSDLWDNLTLLQNLKLRGITTPVYATADTWHDARDLYQAGASYVIFPHYLAGLQFGQELREMLMDKNRLLVDRVKHLAELERRYAWRPAHRS